MGNRPLARMSASTIHVSLARNQSKRSLKSSRSTRRTSHMTSTHRRASMDRAPPETLPENIEHPFELDLMDLKMVRNLCGCGHPLARVDVVVDATGGRRAFVDRRIALHANASDVSCIRQELAIHCYLTRQSILASDGQKPHPHLVELYGHFEFQQTVHILTEYYPSSNLLAVVLPESEGGGSKAAVRFQSDVDVLRAARHICAAVAFMHSEGVAHMDIALENIFVDAHGALRLGDFRHSVYIGKIHPRRRVAPTPVRRAYGAPELYTGREIDLLKTDAWSIGIVLVMLLTKKPPLGEATTHDTHYRLLQVLGVRAFLQRMIQDTDVPPDWEQSPIIQDLVMLLTDLLACEPDRRVSVAEAMTRYPWLALVPPSSEHVELLADERPISVLPSNPADDVSTSMPRKGSGLGCRQKEPEERGEDTPAARAVHPGAI